MATVDHANGAQEASTGYFNPMIGDGSAVTVGGGGAAMPAAFDIEDGNVVRCGLAFGRAWLTCDDTAISALDDDSPAGVVFAEITHGGDEPKLAVKHAAELPANAMDVTHRLLYKAENVGGEKAWADYRWAPGVTAMD